MTRIYNIATRPDLKEIDPGTLKLIWTNHALDRASQKLVTIYKTVKPAGRVVELETRGREVTKLVIRLRIPGSEFDEVLVIKPVGAGIWLVITCWKNHRSDNHSTLNQGRLAS